MPRKRAESRERGLSPEAVLVRAEIVAGMTAEQVSGVEAPALDEYAVQVCRARDARTRIDAEGLIVPDAKGNPVVHPAVRVEIEAQREIRAWVARYRPQPAAASDDDDIDGELSQAS